MIMVLNLESVHAQTTPAQNGRHPATHHPRGNNRQDCFFLTEDRLTYLNSWIALNGARIVASMPKN